MLDAVARASKYGSGRWRRAAATSSTIGVNTRQTVSLTNNEERMPAPNTRATISPAGWLTRVLMNRANAARPPASLKCATMIIMLKSSTMVAKSTDETASVNPIAPVTTISTAPTMAAPVRSRRSHGARPVARIAYVPTRISAVSTYGVSSDEQELDRC